MTKTQQAIDYMAQHNCSAYKAAKVIGVTQSAISREIKRQQALKQSLCPTCGQVTKGEIK